jgi:hypothetical protein
MLARMPTRLPIEDESLPPGVVDLLLQARAAEHAATGSARRGAWRTTRDLWGGVLAAGYSARALGVCVDVGLDSVRTRSARDGWLADAGLVELGVDRQVIDGWRSAGRLPGTRVSTDGSATYPAVEVVRAAAANGVGE